MKTITICDLQNEPSRAARWGEEGERLEIADSGKVLMPDFLARMDEHFPGEVFRGDLVSVVDQDRGDR